MKIKEKTYEKIKRRRRKKTEEARNDVDFLSVALSHIFIRPTNIIEKMETIFLDNNNHRYINDKLIA